MRKTIKVLSLPFAAMLVMAGCGEDNDEVKNRPVEENENKAETNSETGTDNNKKLPFTFKDFQLEVDYAGNDNEYEAEYDAMGVQTEASIDDQLNKHEVHSEEALEELTPILEKLTFTKDSSDDEVIQDVTKAFNLKDDYEEFDLEVNYDDGTKKEYKVYNK
ncbi:MULTISPECIES: YusW family protein [unclassified Peribacillus]|uniref:YusW family protein n=1 Tax=unclassified Peribacillus TaxID=2675266 RepID=UPI001912C038|nr:MULTISPECIES: YusW family protein [unclassified Peribacillus]MBK5442071.1 YusW family protein [Peribacillus sp. TH24]MBK5463154.1 YusW family protein [Peribacillus sp. TH27]MBK5501361.1 YusW family protein [Peribacillus sp. TH14]WMX53667.1 YusW family protein [Peribacillus sp. R9-11]